MTNNYLLGLSIQLKETAQQFTQLEKMILLSNLLVKNSSYRIFRNLKVISNFIVLLVQIFQFKNN